MGGIAEGERGVLGPILPFPNADQCQSPGLCRSHHLSSGTDFVFLLRLKPLCTCKNGDNAIGDTGSSQD